MAKPYYVFDFNAAACMIEVLVNDVHVFSLDLSGQAASMTPINFGILESGPAQLKVRMLPHSGELQLDPNALLDYRVKLFDLSNGTFNLLQEIGKYSFPKPDPEQKLPFAQHELKFNAEVPYQLKGWKDGQKLKDVEDVEWKLRKAYQRMAQLISNKHYDQYLQTIAKREEIMCSSMYLNDEMAKGRAKRLIRDFNDGFEVMPFDEDVIIRYYADGKVASLKKPNGDSALSLLKEETEEELMIELAFYIPAGKTEFEVI